MYLLLDAGLDIIESIGKFVGSVLAVIVIAVYNEYRKKSANMRAMRSVPPSNPAPPALPGVPMVDTSMYERLHNTVEALREALERSISEAESLRSSNRDLTSEVVDLTHSHARLVQRVRELDEQLRSALSGNTAPSPVEPLERIHYTGLITEEYDVHSAPTPPDGMRRHKR